MVSDHSLLDSMSLKYITAKRCKSQGFIILVSSPLSLFPSLHFPLSLLPPPPSLITDAVAVGGAAYGPGVGRVFLQTVLCNGSESALFSCRFSSPSIFSFRCSSHINDASVVCQGKHFHIRIHWDHTQTFTYWGPMYQDFPGKWNYQCFCTYLIFVAVKHSYPGRRCGTWYSSGLVGTRYYTVESLSIGTHEMIVPFVS